MNEELDRFHALVGGAYSYFCPYMSLDSILEGSHKAFLTNEFKEEFLVLNKALERFLDAIQKGDKEMKREKENGKRY